MKFLGDIATFAGLACSMLRSSIGRSLLAVHQSLLQAAQCFEGLVFEVLVFEVLVFEVLKETCPARRGKAGRTGQIVST
jgi:hypothetical protein